MGQPHCLRYRVGVTVLSGGAPGDDETSTWFQPFGGKVLDARHILATVALWSQYFTFNFGTVYKLSSFVPELRCRRMFIGRRLAYGAQCDSENCPGRGEKRAANFRTSTQT